VKKELHQVSKDIGPNVSSGPNQFFFFFIVFLLLLDWGLTQGFAFAKQVLYYLSHSSNSFRSGYFDEGGLVNYLLASNYHPPHLSLSNS
jgi:hypothetical protein